MKAKIIALVFLLFTCFGFSQEKKINQLTFNEYLGYVKLYHPLVKQANLQINMAQANLLMARGAFDPKIEVDFDKKQFQNKEYYSVLNSSFKIPTWYGVEIKAGFDNSEGMYLNPQNTTPNQGLTSLGVTVPLGQGLLINQRMADLQKAKMQIKLSQAERKLQAIAVLYEASVVYFNWKKNADEVALYANYWENAKIRKQGIKTLIEQGDKPAIDSIEAEITVKNRLLSLEDSKLKLAKTKLDLSNFLWLENNIPLELTDEIQPEANILLTIEETLKTNDLLQTNFSITDHPKINALQTKVDILNVERKLKANQLLPKIDVGYHYLSEPSAFNNYQFNDYKVGVNVYFPIFLRKERGNLKLAQFKVQETQFLLNLEKVQLSNKIKAQQTEIRSLLKQKALLNTLVKDYAALLSSEERLFSFGESSVFLINTRENNFVSSQIAQIAIENRYCISHAELFRILVNVE